MKKALIAILLFTLILASFALLLTPKVKADTSEAQVLSYSWYVAPATTVQATYIGDLIAVGEVADVGSNSVDRVIVTGVAYNSTGAALASVQTPAFSTYLLPGQKAPFYLDFTPQNSVTQDQSWVPLVSNVSVTVSYVSDTNQTQYSGLVIPAGSISATNSTGTYTVTGSVQNTGNQATGSVWVVSTFYNASGTVVGLNYTDYLTNSLSPGNVARFTATPIDNTAQLSNEITNYSLLIQSLPLTQATPTPTASLSPTPTPSTSTQPTASPAPISLGLISTIAVVIVVLILAVLAAIFLFRRRQKNAQFEPPPPPPPPPPP